MRSFMMKKNEWAGLVACGEKIMQQGVGTESRTKESPLLNVRRWEDNIKVDVKYVDVEDNLDLDRDKWRDCCGHGVKKYGEFLDLLRDVTA